MSSTVYPSSAFINTVTCSLAADKTTALNPTACRIGQRPPTREQIEYAVAARYNNIRKNEVRQCQLAREITTPTATAGAVRYVAVKDFVSLQGDCSGVDDWPRRARLIECAAAAIKRQIIRRRVQHRISALQRVIQQRRTIQTLLVASDSLNATAETAESRFLRHESALLSKYADCFQHSADDGANDTTQSGDDNRNDQTGVFSVNSIELADDGDSAV